MSKVKKALVLSSGAELAIKVMNFVGVVSYARLLSVEELGVYIIASAIMMLASEVTILGTNTYIIREKQLSKESLQSCIGLAILIAWSLGIITLSVSGLLASYYAIDDLQLLICVLSVSFFLAPFTSSTVAFLSKSFNYKQVVSIRLTAVITGVAASLILILFGFSYFALAIGQALLAIVSFLLARLLRPADMSWKFRFSNLKPILTVGIFTSLINLTHKFEITIPDIILGKIASPLQVALTSRAIGLHVFVRDILSMGIMGVALPYLSNAANEAELRASYIRASILVATFVAPPIAVAAIFANELIIFLFGQQWIDSVPIAQLLGVWMVLKSYILLASPALIAAKYEKVFLYYRIAVVITLGCAIYAVHNLLGVNIGFAFVVVAMFEVVAVFFMLRRLLGIRIIPYMTNLGSSLCVLLICVLVAGVIRLLMPEDILEILSLLIVGGCLTPIWLIALKLLRHPLYQLIIELPIVNRLVAKV